MKFGISHQNGIDEIIQKTKKQLRKRLLFLFLSDKSFYTFRISTKTCV